MKRNIVLLFSVFIIVATMLTTTANTATFGVLGDINDDGKIGLEEAIYALQVVAGLKVKPQLSLAGTWELNSLASGLGAPWWERGTLVIGSDGSFSASVTESDGSTASPSGILDISTAGIVTMSGSCSFRGSMDSGKTVMVWTDTWSTGNPGTTEIKVITRQAESYSLADLAGTWEVSSLASGPGAPWWSRGSISINSDGSFSGTLEEYGSAPDSVSGTLSISSDGIITQDVDPDFRAAMDSDKTVIAGTATWDEWKPGTTYISVWTKKAQSYSLADLAGTWEVSSLASGPGAPWWLRVCITIDSHGLFSGTQTESDGHIENISGTLSISSDGIITSQDVNPDFRAGMDSDKTVIVGTATWDEWKPGTTYISVWTKTRE